MSKRDLGILLLKEASSLPPFDDKQTPTLERSREWLEEGSETVV